MALAIEEKYDQVRQLIAMGKERGYLLYDEVNDILPAEVHSSDEIDDLLSTFERYGIDIYEDLAAAKAARATADPAASEAPEVESKDELPVAGAMQLSGEMSDVPPHWAVTFNVDDVDASFAVATSNVTRSATPAASARARAVSIDPRCESNPTKVEFGKAWAMRIVDSPCPQPISATAAPAMSLASTPSRDGIQTGTMLAS